MGKNLGNPPVHTTGIKEWGEKLEDYDIMFKYIDKDTFPSIFDTEVVFRNYIINNGGGLVTKNGHPNKESHQLWADYLEENIK